MAKAALKKKVVAKKKTEKKLVSKKRPPSALRSAPLNRFAAWSGAGPGWAPGQSSGPYPSIAF